MSHCTWEKNQSGGIGLLVKPLVLKNNRGELSVRLQTKNLKSGSAIYKYLVFVSVVYSPFEYSQEITSPIYATLKGKNFLIYKTFLMENWMNKCNHILLAFIFAKSAKFSKVGELMEKS